MLGRIYASIAARMSSGSLGIAMSWGLGCITQYCGTHISLLAVYLRVIVGVNLVLTHCDLRVCSSANSRNDVILLIST